MLYPPPLIVACFFSLFPTHPFSRDRNPFLPLTIGVFPIRFFFPPPLCHLRDFFPFYLGKDFPEAFIPLSDFNPSFLTLTNLFVHGGFSISFQRGFVLSPVFW